MGAPHSIAPSWRIAVTALALAIGTPTLTDAQATISTVPDWDGVTNAPLLARDFLPATVGQTFTAPSGVASLTGFSHFLGYAPIFQLTDMQFYAYVYGWDGVGPTSELWRSTLQSGATDLPLVERHVTTAVLPLMTGQQYVVFLSTLEADPFDPFDLLGSPAYQNLGLVETDPYAGGTLVQSFSDSFADLFSAGAWVADPFADLALTLRFQDTPPIDPPGTPVPEPSPLTLLAASLATGALALSRLLRRRSL